MAMAMVCDDGDWREVYVHTETDRLVSRPVNWRNCFVYVAFVPTDMSRIPSIKLAVGGVISKADVSWSCVSMTPTGHQFQLLTSP